MSSLGERSDAEVMQGMVGRKRVAAKDDRRSCGRNLRRRLCKDFEGVSNKDIRKKFSAQIVEESEKRSQKSVQIPAMINQNHVVPEDSVPEDTKGSEESSSKKRRVSGAEERDSETEECFLSSKEKDGNTEEECVTPRSVCNGVCNGGFRFDFDESKNDGEIQSPEVVTPGRDTAGDCSSSGPELPQLAFDNLVNIICKMDHSDLRAALTVSKEFSEAAILARKEHFLFLTPRKNKRSSIPDPLEFMNSHLLGCVGENFVPVTPNAPIKVSKPRKAFMNDADLQVRLFEADPEPVEADTEDVYSRGLDFISGRLL